jgi:hypothetical protein
MASITLGGNPINTTGVYQWYSLCDFKLNFQTDLSIATMGGGFAKTCF